MLNVAAALRLIASESRLSRMTLESCADQVDRAVTILEVALERIEGVKDGPVERWILGAHIRQALARLRAYPPQNLAREGEGAAGSEVRATTNLPTALLQGEPD